MPRPAPHPPRAESDSIEAFAQGLDFAAELAHAEARWQTELVGRAGDEASRHLYAAERSTVLEAALRSVAELTRPTT